MNENLEKYYAVRPQIKTGDLLEWATASPLGYAIRWITGMPVNHTSIVAVMRLDGSPTQRKYIYEADEHGFHPAWISTRVERFKGHLYWVPLSLKYREFRNEIANNFLKYEGKPYDWSGLVRNAFGRVELNDKRLWCSEVVQADLRDTLPENEFHEAMVDAKLAKYKGWEWVYYGIRPGEFSLTGIYKESIKIF